MCEQSVALNQGRKALTLLNRLWSVGFSGVGIQDAIGKVLKRSSAKVELQVKIGLRNLRALLRFRRDA